MLTIRQAELIFPTGGEYRCTRSLGLASVFCNTLIDLRSIQVECDQILTVGMDDLTKQLVLILKSTVALMSECGATRSSMC